MSKVKDWIEDKVAATKDAAYVKAYQAKMWAKEHPEEAATIITTAIGAMRKAGLSYGDILTRMKLL